MIFIALQSGFTWLDYLTGVPILRFFFLSNSFFFGSCNIVATQLTTLYNFIIYCASDQKILAILDNLKIVGLLVVFIFSVKVLFIFFDMFFLLIRCEQVFGQILPPYPTVSSILWSECWIIKDTVLLPLVFIYDFLSFLPHVKLGTQGGNN